MRRFVMLLILALTVGVLMATAVPMAGACADGSVVPCEGTTSTGTGK